jgi:hypothetical protein
MKKMMLWIAAFSISGIASFAQNITGTWQGALQETGVSRKLRIVIRISTSDDPDGLKAGMYSLDQGGQVLTATTVGLRDSILKMTIAGIGGTYEGQLSADGNSIAGTWTQGRKTLPLDLTRANPETAWALPEPPDWRRAIQLRLLSQFRLTKATADKSAIVTAGTVIVLKKDDLVLYSTDRRYPPGNTYKEGRITQGFLGALDRTSQEGTTRTFVAGEKLWFTRIAFEAKGNGVELEFLSDPFNDVRYWGTIKFAFPKGSPPDPDDFARAVAQVFRADRVAESAPAAQFSSVAPPQPVEQTPPPITPPPPPADEQPPTVSLGQTKDEVLGNLGQPSRIANLGTKQILYYTGFKVTLVDGKVTDVE